MTTPSPTRWVLCPFILAEYCRQQRQTIAGDGNPLKEGLSLLLTAHGDMKNEAPGQSIKEENRTKKGPTAALQREEKKKRRDVLAEAGGRRGRASQVFLGVGMAEECLTFN